MAALDQEILLRINTDWTGPAMDRFMCIATSISLWIPFLILIGILVALFGGFRGRAALVCVGLSIGLVDGVLTNNVKDLVQRPRPYQLIDGLRMPELARVKPTILAVGMPLRLGRSAAEIGPYGGRSLPSGHAANNFALATVVTLFYRRWGWLYFLPASIVAYSRIYVAAHWPSDILVSVFMGSGGALIVTALAAWAWNRWAPRWVPALALRHPDLLPA